MKPWPVYRDFAMKFGPTNVASEAYNYAMADAWEERCRLAVEALRSVPQCQFCDAHLGKVVEALAAIGPIPPSDQV